MPNVIRKSYFGFFAPLVYILISRKGVHLCLRHHLSGGMENGFRFSSLIDYNLTVKYFHKQHFLNLIVVSSRVIFF